MIGYGMFVGGMARCVGKTRTGERCRRNGYVLDISRYSFHCHQHPEVVQ